MYKIGKKIKNFMLVGMASELSKNYRYKCVDRSRHNTIKGAKAKCAHQSNLSAHEQFLYLVRLLFWSLH